MVERLLEQKVALDAYFVNTRRDLLLSEAQWAMLEELQEMLDPAAESKMLCRDDAPLPMQITVRRGLVDELNSLELNILADERNRLVEQIQHRMAGLEQYRCVQVKVIKLAEMNSFFFGGGGANVPAFLFVF